MQSHSNAAAGRVNWPLLLGFWALVAAGLIARAVYTSASVPLLADTDDAMRLVIVRDFLGGQGWYDHAQHRLNTPFGADMHWSRLIDAAIGGLILLFTPLFGGMAATIAAYVWPLLQLLVLLYLSARLTLRLVGPEGMLPAVALPVLSPVIAAEFVPGRLDHHGMQVILMVALVWCAIEALERPRWAIAAGLVAATAFAVGAEAAPGVAAAVLAFGLIWVFRPERADALRGFGLSFGIGTALHLAIAFPPGRWLEPACDAISFVYVSTALSVGVGFTILSFLPVARSPVLVRLALGAAAGATVLIGVVIAFPDCLAGAYAGLDPWLAENWGARVTESRPIWRSFAAMPEFSIALGIPALLAVAVVGWRLLRGDPTGRPSWLVLGLFLAVTVVVTLVMVRGGRISGIVAVPAGALLIATARAWYLRTRKVGAIAALVGSWIGFAGIALLLLSALVIRPFSSAGDVRKPSRDVCFMPAAFADLAAMPSERIMTPVDLGAHVLAFTPHSVVGAPYPRNNYPNWEGIRDAFAFFSGPIEEARAILEKRGIGLVVLCPELTEMRGVGEVAPDSFIRLYAKSELPPWLTDVSLPGAALKVFAVDLGR